MSPSTPIDPRARREGFTLLEVMISTVVFMGVGYGLSRALDIADRSHGLVTNSASVNGSLREATSTLRLELQSTSADRMTIQALPDGNQQVTLMLPIEVGHVPAWGVYDKRLGRDAATQSRADWRLVYTVAPGPGGRRDLVRRVLDDAGTVQREDRLVSGLCAGGTTTPGLRVVATGDVWVVTISLEGREGGNVATESFDVRLRN